MQIATPGNPRYGNHLDHEQISALTGPKEESVSLVKEWLQSEIPSGKTSVAGDYITVEGTVNAVEKLLKTTYSTYGKKMTFFAL